MDGLAALTRRPLIYVSGESHHSFVKIARMSGLGTSAIREVPITDQLVMDPDALHRMMVADATLGHLPMMVVGTAGTTSAGMVDPLPAIADVAAHHGAWFHADAAWGGAAALSPTAAPTARRDRASRLDHLGRAQVAQRADGCRDGLHEAPRGDGEGVQCGEQLHAAEHLAGHQ